MKPNKMSTRALLEYLVKKVKCCSDNSGPGGPETDPIFSASPAATITQEDIDLWNSGGGNFVPMAGMDLIAGERMQEGFLLSNYNIISETPPDNSISVGMSQLLGGFVYQGTALNGGVKFTGSFNAGPTAVSSTIQTVDGIINSNSTQGTNSTNTINNVTSSDGDFTGTSQITTSVNTSAKIAQINLLVQGNDNTAGETFNNQIIIDKDGVSITTLEDDAGTANSDVVMDPSGKLFKRPSNLKADLVSGKVPASQLPSYVDDIIEEANLAAFPNPGEQGKLYVALDTNKIYRWSGSAYIDMTPGEADTLQTVMVRGNSTNTALVFQPAQGRAGEMNFSPTTYSYWWGNFNTAHTGTYNLAIGYNTLNKLTSGNSNVSIGSNSGEELTTSNYSTFLGYLSGQKTTTGYLNTFLGDESGNRNTTGFKNTYVGSAAGYNSTTGSLNTLLGYKSGLGTMTDCNTMLGAFSGEGVTGRNNVLIGLGAGRSDGAISNKLIIHSNNTLTGYSNTADGNYGSFQQSQLSRALITGDFLDRWVRINGYIVVGSPAVSTDNISIIPGQGIKSVLQYTPTLDTDYVQKQYADTKSIPLINTTTVYTTSAELNTAYPNALLGQEVYTTGEETFFKKVTPTTWGRVTVALI